MGQYLAKQLRKWLVRGNMADGTPLPDNEGWELRLNTRAVGAAFVWLFLVAALWTILVVGQFVEPQPVRSFMLLIAGYSAVVLFYAGYVVFHLVYRVTLTAEGIELRRFPFRTRRLAWSDVFAVRYAPGDHVLRIESRRGPNETIPLRLTLNGLPRVRKALATDIPPEKLAPFWAQVDPLLAEQIPGWVVQSRSAVFPSSVRMRGD